MLHIRLLEMEAEKIAREMHARSAASRELPQQCEELRQHVEREVGMQLGALCERDFRGWLTYRRPNQDLLVIRGRAFKESGFMGGGKWRAGLDVTHGLDSVGEVRRGFDVSPPSDLDHLTVNFGADKLDSARVYIWYGENIAPYRLIYDQDVEEAAGGLIDAALSEAMSWVLNKPVDMTLPVYIKSLKT